MSQEVAIPFLSIVIPTRPGFSEHWLTELLKVKGRVEFILIHPPGTTPPLVNDPRMKQIVSPLRGEVIQRSTGLINASGTYILSLNCDEYLHPDIENLVRDYFARFPDSWVLRLTGRDFPYGDLANLSAPWPTIPEVQTLGTCSKRENTQALFKENTYLLEIPIAPLEKPIDWSALSGFRKDHHGPHMENFDKRVWKNELVRPAIREITESMSVAGPIKYVPFWCLDRTLGLYIQAKFFDPDKTIGHWMPSIAEQIRIEDNPPDQKRSNRFYFLVEILLVKKFPERGYFWNLIFSQGRDLANNIRYTLFPRKD
ncbi:hypothetical protein V0288_11840 [Pannus brasiliensis CCIBt3594]|uniref:Glycosyltransferase family 2 protein n=1 Tax=Pannus brasiliensis CCIBt3594 TaxID=1427578 RepID=A0AAW9QLL0_9CHRO